MEQRNSDFFDLVKKRQSCRNYADRVVEKGKLLKCIEALRLSPSACNSQPWKLIAVTNRELAAKVAKCTQDMNLNRFTDQCPVFIIVLEDKVVLSSKFGGNIDHQKYAQIDIGLSVAHFCLAATAQGLSTCILGWLNPEKLHETLPIPEEQQIRLVLALGYAETDSIREKVRKPLEEIVTFMD